MGPAGQACCRLKLRLFTLYMVHLCTWHVQNPPKTTRIFPGDSTMKLVVWLKLVLVDYTLW